MDPPDLIRRAMCPFALLFNVQGNLPWDMNLRGKGTLFPRLRRSDHGKQNTRTALLDCFPRTLHDVQPAQTPWSVAIGNLG
eukprot:3893793-Rhodomonas_salina.2